jgi:two-component system, NarL family, invasion response regulator UvrY
MIQILIADDHAVIRRGIKQLLLEEYPSAKIEEAGNGEELLSKAINGEWDVVLCDLTMPGLHGLDVLRQIKQSLPDLPVLIMSMHPEDQYGLDVLKAGASGYLEKRLIHHELIKAVQTVLLGKKFLTSYITEKLADNFNKDKTKQPHELLSGREIQVFKLLVSGKSVSEIAEALSLGVTTVSTFRSRIMEKMGMHSNADLVRYSISRNLI